MVACAEHTETGSVSITGSLRFPVAGSPADVAAEASTSACRQVTARRRGREQPGKPRHSPPVETPLAPQVTARKSPAPRLVLGSAEWLRRDRRQAFLFPPPGFTHRQVWESLKPKKKPPRPSSEMDGEQSARRKHERPRTALMSCLFIFHTYSVQPRGGGGGSTRLLSRACLSAADHSGSAEEFSFSQSFLSWLRKTNQILFTQSVIWQTSAYFYTPSDPGAWTRTL